MAHPICKVRSTSEFEKSFRRLLVDIQDIADKKDLLFRQDAFDPRLRTHKLRGELEGYWAYSVNWHYRVLFRFLNENEVVYYDIGTHDIYQERGEMRGNKATTKMMH